MSLLLCCDGDSITAAASYVDAADGNISLDGNGNHLYVRKLDPIIDFGNTIELTASTNNFAIPGSQLTDAVIRASTIKTHINSDGRLCIFTVNIGHNDYALSTIAANYLTALATYLDSMRSVQVKVGCCTLLPSTVSGGVGTFNTWRGLVNTGIRGFAGGHCDFVIDMGSTSTTMGADAAASDTSLYPDGIHPGRNELLGIVYANAVNTYVRTLSTVSPLLMRTIVTTSTVELREDGSQELREDGSLELRG